MRTTKFSHLMTVALMIATVSITSCKKSSGTDNTTPAPVAITGVQITYNQTFGNILTDNTGRTLYFFSKDAAPGASACTGNCLVTWLPFYQANPTLGTGVVAADFGVITLPDNSKQTTYKGWPLYYNVNDVNTGDVKGDAVGSLWAVAKADYTVMFANAQLVSLEGANYTSLGVAGNGISQYLTDDKGRTLYYNTNDTFNRNTFTNTDPNHNAIWPFAPTTGVDDIPTVFTKSQFGVIATVTGGQQLTYRGHPLYYFGQDNTTKGNTKGISFPTPGAATWRVANTSIPVLQ